MMILSNRVDGGSFITTKSSGRKVDFAEMTITNVIRLISDGDWISLPYGSSLRKVIKLIQREESSDFLKNTADSTRDDSSYLLFKLESVLS